MKTLIGLAFSPDMRALADPVRRTRSALARMLSVEFPFATAAAISRVFLATVNAKLLLLSVLNSHSLTPP